MLVLVARTEDGKEEEIKVKTKKMGSCELSYKKPRS